MQVKHSINVILNQATPAIKITERERERERETERQRDRETERQRETERETERGRERKGGREGESLFFPCVLARRRKIWEYHGERE